MSSDLETFKVAHRTVSQIFSGIMCCFNHPKVMNILSVNGTNTLFYNMKIG